MHWVVIPFRGPEGAKTRLAEALSPDARESLARAMFQHVLRVACRAAGPDRVMVATPSRTAARLAASSGAVVLRERAGELNSALVEARDALRRRRAQTMTIVVADLPLITPADIAKLVATARQGRITIAMDRRLTGTNALVVPVAGKFDFKFGPDSAIAHARQARQRQLTFRTFRHDAFAADVDGPADLELLRRPDALTGLPGLASGAYRGVR